jgi:3-deoxy-manno-octulosonate cytidylyltransferase (CMP-KDO synthetase)
MNPKLKSRTELAAVCDALRRQGKRLVFTNGCFDLLHVGHVRYLKAARALGDVLVVGLNSDSSVRQLKGDARPLVPEEERAEVLAALDCVDHLSLFAELRPNDLIQAVKPAVHVKGGDYRVEDLPEASLVRSLGGEVVVVPVVPGRSTTNLIQRLTEGASAAPTATAGARAVAIIPARYASTRLDGKALVDIAGKPMIQHVYERAREAEALEDVIVATDDERIYEAARAFGGAVRMTRADHQSGTDRVAEVAAGLDCDLIVNVQGDEPFLDPDDINRAVAPLREDPTLQMGTLKVRLTDPAELDDPNSVKVVTDANGLALYFSRESIPHHRDQGAERCLFKHLGLYVYRRSFLLDFFRRTPPSHLEKTEKLEQLRVLEHGYRIKVVETPNDSIGVDTPEDLRRVRELARLRDEGMRR